MKHDSPLKAIGPHSGAAGKKGHVPGDFSHRTCEFRAIRAGIRFAQAVTREVLRARSVPPSASLATATLHVSDLSP
jgi:hypothetical protein